MSKVQGNATVPFEVIDKAIEILLKIRGEMDHLGHEGKGTREKAAWAWLTTSPLPYKRIGDAISELDKFLPQGYCNKCDL